MYTWSYYEFKETVSFPAMGPLSRADVHKFRRVLETERGVVFTMANDEVRLVPWTNVRWAGGVITPALTYDDQRPELQGLTAGQLAVALNGGKQPVRKTTKK